MDRRQTVDVSQPELRRRNGLITLCYPQKSYLSLLKEHFTDANLQHQGKKKGK